MKLLVTDVRFTPASELDQATGLDGWVSATINGLRVRGLAIRRSRVGRCMVVYPTRRDASGREHTIVLPIARGMQRRVERALLDELERQGALVP